MEEEVVLHEVDNAIAIPPSLCIRRPSYCEDLRPLGASLALWAAVFQFSTLFSPPLVSTALLLSSLPSSIFHTHDMLGGSLLGILTNLFWTASLM